MHAHTQMLESKANNIEIFLVVLGLENLLFPPSQACILDQSRPNVVHLSEQPHSVYI